MKYSKLTYTVPLMILLLLAVAAQGQDTQAPTAPPPDPAPWSVGGIKFSGLVDGYYNLNFNHPASGINGLRNFDVKANQFSLNMAKLSMSHDADPIGFTMELGFGRAFEIVHSFEPEDSPSVMRNVEQAFISVKPPNAGGFQFDFGKFVTSAGAEVIETHPNWNYSRSILFAWAIPFYHFGVRMTKPVGAHWTPGIQIVNGWNNVEDNNSGKTVGLTSALTSSMASLYNSYYVGPEKVGTNDGYRHLFDTNLVLTPSDKASLYFNVDYGVEKFKGEPSAKWYGVAAAARLAANDWFAVTPRIEWFKDRDGFSTGTPQALKEFTLTAEFKHAKGFFSRFEYRRDWSDTDYFERGAGGTGKNQNTLLVGFVAFFGE